MTGVTAPTIGGYAPAYFNGQIDEFRIWNVACSASEIAGTMSHTLVGNEAGLTGYWKFDETSGTSAADSVTSTNHTPHPGMLSASSTANNPTWVVSTAPISFPYLVDLVLVCSTASPIARGQVQVFCNRRTSERDK